MPVLPLPPKIHSQSSAGPRFQAGEHARGLTEVEVASPSNEVWFQLIDDLWQGLPRVRQVMSRIRALNLSRAFRRNAPLAPVIRDAESQELPLLWACHRAFR